MHSMEICDKKERYLKNSVCVFSALIHEKFLGIEIHKIKMTLRWCYRIMLFYLVLGQRFLHVDLLGGLLLIDEGYFLIYV